MPEFREILVVELLGGFGDLLLALPAIHALAGSQPGANVRVLTFEPGDQLLAADPAVAEVVPYADHREGAPLRAVRAQLDRQRPDLVVSTTAYGGIRELLTGWPARTVVDLWRRPPPDELVDLRFLRILVDEGLVDPAYAELAPAVVLGDEERAAGDVLLPATAGPPVLLLPDAGMPIKQWPVAGWVVLAERLREVGAAPLSSGADLPGVPRLPRTDLRRFAAALAAVDARGGAVVGGDTGPLRLAAAVGTPAVGLFGPTLASRYGVRGPAAANLQGLPNCAVRRPTSITEQECWWTARCPLTGGEPGCLLDLDPDQVLATVRPFLDPVRDLDRFG